MATGILRLTFAQLFSFQVLHNKEGGGPGKKWRSATLVVDFSARTVRLQQKEQTLESQPFSAYDKYFGADAESPLVSLSFEGDLWRLFTQNVAEKSCIQHLLQCARKELSAEEARSLGHGIIGLDRRIMKSGFILRKAKTCCKKDERFLVLVPGKLFLFKGKDITNRHARYVTSLFGATVRKVDSLLEFQILSPNSRAITFIASDAEDLASWLELLEKSIECAECGKSYSNMRDTAVNCSKTGTYASDSPLSSRSEQDQFGPLQLGSGEGYSGDKSKKKQEKRVKDVKQSRINKDAEELEPKDAEEGYVYRHGDFSHRRSSERKLSHDFYNPYADEEELMNDYYYTYGGGRNKSRRKERRHRLNGRRAEACAFSSIKTGNDACGAVPRRHRIPSHFTDEAKHNLYGEQYGESCVSGRRHRGNTREFAEERDGWTSAPVGSVAYYRSGGMRKINGPDINETSSKQRNLGRPCTYEGKALVRGSGYRKGGFLQDESDPPGYEDDGFAEMKSSFDGLSNHRTERRKYSRWTDMEVPPSDFSRIHYNLSQNGIPRQRMLSQVEEELSALDLDKKRGYYGKQAKHFEQGRSFVESILGAESSAVDLARRASRRFYN